MERILLASFISICSLIYLAQPSSVGLLNLPSSVMPGGSIIQHKPLLFHFIHTTKEADFNHRCVRAIESVFYHHPNARVIIHIPQDGENIGLHSDMTDKPILPLQKAGYNVTVQPFQLKPLVDAAISQQDSIVERGPAENWMETKILPNVMGYFWYMDISDLVRLLVLYTGGGMYLDTDVIVVKPLYALPNSIGFERPNGPSGAVLKFEKGNTFLAECINEYFATFISSTVSWGHVGPSLLLRVYSRKYEHCQISGRDQLDKTDPSSCPVVVLWKDAFYPNVDNCLTNTPNTQAKKEHIQEHSFVVHTYNQRTFAALKSISIRSMTRKDTLCNWLFSSWCILCDENVWA